jgi:hypothetical protein
MDGKRYPSWGRMPKSAQPPLPPDGTTSATEHANQPPKKRRLSDSGESQNLDTTNLLNDLEDLQAHRSVCLSTHEVEIAELQGENRNLERSHTQKERVLVEKIKKLEQVYADCNCQRVADYNIYHQRTETKLTNLREKHAEEMETTVDERDFAEDRAKYFEGEIQLLRKALRESETKHNDVLCRLFTLQSKTGTKNDTLDSADATPKAKTFNTTTHKARHRTPKRRGLQGSHRRSGDQLQVASPQSTNEAPTWGRQDEAEVVPFRRRLGPWSLLPTAQDPLQVSARRSLRMAV